MRKIAAALLVSLLLLALGAPWALAQNVTPPPYPQGGIPVGITATGTTGSVTATLPARSGRTTFICSFVISSGGSSSASVVPVTLTGLPAIFGTLSWQYVFVSSGQGLLGTAFPYCIPALAQNTTISVTVPGGGAGTNISVTLTGFQMTGSPPS